MLIKTIFLTGELRDSRGKRTVMIIIIIIINFSKHNYCLEKFPTKLNLSFNRSFCSRPEHSVVNTLLSKKTVASAIILFLILKFKLIL